MTILNLMKRCRAYEQDLGNLNWSLAIWRDTAVNMTAPVDGLSGGGGGSSDKIGRVTAAIDEVEREIARRKFQYEFERVEVTAQLTRPSCGIKEEILIDYYLAGKSVAEIAHDRGYSESYISKLKRNGEKKYASVAITMPEVYMKSAIESTERGF